MIGLVFSKSKRLNSIPSEKWHPESINGGNILFVARKCFGIKQRAQVLVLKRLIWYLCQSLCSLISYPSVWAIRVSCANPPRARQVPPYQCRYLRVGSLGSLRCRPFHHLLSAHPNKYASTPFKPFSQTSKLRATLISNEFIVNKQKKEVRRFITGEADLSSFSAPNQALIPEIWISNSSDCLQSPGSFQSLLDQENKKILIFYYGSCSRKKIKLK